MKTCRFAVLGTILFLLGTVQANPSAAADRAGESPLFINGVRDTGQFLPDTAVLARVDDHVIRAGDFVSAYFNSYAEYRPAPDSAGRARFLQSMVRKEVLARIAFAANRPLTFEDRFVLRDYESQVVSNVLFQRLVLDKVTIPEPRVQDLYRQFQRQLHMRHILLDDPALARKVRFDLQQGRITWSAAVARYSKDEKTKNRDGDLGWMLRSGTDPYTADQLWALRPGETSQPLTDDAGVHLMQLVETKPVETPSLETLRSQIEGVIRQQMIDSLSSGLQTRLAEEAGMTYDSTAIRRAVALMPAPPDQSQGLVIQMDAPHLADRDTAMVLARYDGGQVTLGYVLNSWSGISPLMRPPLNSMGAMIHQIQGVGLNDHRVGLARSMHLERDSITVTMMHKREEQLRVEHMYADSITSKVYIPSEDRRKYYEANKHLFFTYPEVTFAAFAASTRDSVDEIAGRLRAGEDPEAILMADSLRGVHRGSIQHRRQGEHGPFQKVLFEELRAGDVTILGPDNGGVYAIVKLLARDDGHQLPFSEVDALIDESLRNMKSEQMLLEMLGRHSSQFHVETHEDRLMNVRLVDPLL